MLAVEIILNGNDFCRQIIIFLNVAHFAQIKFSFDVVYVKC